MTKLTPKQFQLNQEQIAELVNLTEFRNRDVFYDVGCGEGTVVIEVAKLNEIKKSVGIEYGPEPYETARKNAITALNPDQLLKVDFVRGFV